MEYEDSRIEWDVEVHWMNCAMVNEGFGRGHSRIVGRVFAGEEREKYGCGMQCSAYVNLAKDLI